MAAKGNGRILILGAGYGGLRVALDLGQLLKGQGPEVTLVDQNDYHQLITRLHEAAAASIPLEAVKIPLRPLLERRGVNFIQARVLCFDFQARQVLTSAGPLDYGWLVIALGSETDFFGIPGLEEHALTLKSADDAQHIRNHIRRTLALAVDGAGDEERKAQLTFVVGGGGHTGTELAAELADWLGENPLRKGNGARVVVVEAGPAILSGFDEELVARATQSLRSKGVELYLGRRVAGVDADGVTLDSGERIATKTIIWTGGVSAVDTLSGCGLETGPRGRVVVDRFLESVDHPGVYLVGDNALVQDPQTGRPLPPSAQLALAQAKVVAWNIYAQIKGLKKRAFQYKPSSEVISLGRWDGVGVVANLKLSGVVAALLKHLIPLRYLYSIGGIGLALRGLIQAFPMGDESRLPRFLLPLANGKKG